MAHAKAGAPLLESPHVDAARVVDEADLPVAYDVVKRVFELTRAQHTRHRSELLLDELVDVFPRLAVNVLRRDARQVLLEEVDDLLAMHAQRMAV